MKNPLNYFDIDHGDSMLCEKCREFFDEADGVYNYTLNLISPPFYCTKCALDSGKFNECEKCQELNHQDETACTNCGVDFDED